ncbi:MAG: IPT/TIG domain-containing protein [Kofleriaceae bacterium]|nr:IPT/TIG domain-containing protein [Kofleriaceae bacterium]
MIRQSRAHGQSVGFALISTCLLAVWSSCGSVTDQKGAVPTIASISPDHGSALGGYTVTITGTNFQAEPGEPLVVFNGALVSNAVAISDTEITFTVPAAANGAAATSVDISVAVQSGFTKLEKGFRYNAQPLALTIEPLLGRSVGGTAIKITGRGFITDEAGTPTVEIAGVAATNVQVVDDTTIIAVTAPAAPNSPGFAPVVVQVKNANGNPTLDDQFRLSKPGLLATEKVGGERSRIFFVDPETKAVTLLSTAQRRLIGCATSPTGEVFSSTGRGGNQPRQLVKLNPTDGAVVSIGTLKTPDNATHRIGAMTFVGSTLIGTSTGCCTNFKRLVTINPTSAVLTAMGATPTMTNGNAIAPKDATSVFYATNTSTVLHAAVVANSTLGIGPTLNGSLLPNKLQGMALFGSTLFLAEGTSEAITNIYTVNTSNGRLTPFATTPAEINGLCPTPSTF